MLTSRDPNDVNEIFTRLDPIEIEQNEILKVTDFNLGFGFDSEIVISSKNLFLKYRPHDEGSIYNPWRPDSKNGEDLLFGIPIQIDYQEL